jgi:formylglycine-generating enzyme required for sulfatase activity
VDEPLGVEWPDTGINVQVMAPGQPNCKYHSEPVERETSDPAEAYAEWRRVPRRPTENPWPL